MYEYNDEEFGKIVVSKNIRAKRIIARRKNEHIQLTVPYGFDFNTLSTLLDELRPRLKKNGTPENRIITEDTVLETFSFTARLSKTGWVNDVQIHLKNRELVVLIPSGSDLKNPRSQAVVKEMLRCALRHEAKRVLRQKTMSFAQQFDLQVNNVKVNRSVSRWGSCSREKNINFSLYLMLLPEKYIDYVILHELAHTVEMNHSRDFWELLSEFCGEDAKALGRIVRKYKSPEYELLKS